MSINPPDIPGYTQMYSFGIRLHTGYGAGERTEYLVITVRHLTEELASRHVEAIFRGNYAGASLTFFTDMEAWKREANPDRKEPV